MGVIFVRTAVRRGPCRSVPVSAGFVVCILRIFHLNIWRSLSGWYIYEFGLDFGLFLVISMIPILHRIDKCKCIHACMHAYMHLFTYRSIELYIIATVKPVVTTSTS